MTHRRLKGKEFLLHHLRGGIHCGDQYSDHNVNPYVLEAILDSSSSLNLSSSSNSTLFVLEFGARAGALGNVLSARMGRSFHYLGVEPYPPPNLKLQNIITANCEDAEDPTSLVSKLIAKADILVYADVLEHLRDPWLHLKHVAQLKYNQVFNVVASIPNFFHHENLNRLSDLEFCYEEWGVRDFTHLRFFGLEDILSLFELNGFVVRRDNVKMAFDPVGLEIFHQVLRGEQVTLGNGVIKAHLTTPEHAKLITPYQYIFSAKYSSGNQGNPRY
jgi:hypothetical protein